MYDKSRDFLEELEDLLDEFGMDSVIYNADLEPEDGRIVLNYPKDSHVTVAYTTFRSGLTIREK